MFPDFFNSATRMITGRTSNTSPEDRNQHITATKHIPIDDLLGSFTHLRNSMCFPSDWEKNDCRTFRVQIIPLVDNRADYPALCSDIRR